MARASESDHLTSALLAWIIGVTALAFGLVLAVYNILVSGTTSLSG